MNCFTLNHKLIPKLTAALEEKGHYDPSSDGHGYKKIFVHLTVVKLVQSGTKQCIKLVPNVATEPLPIAALKKLNISRVHGARA